MLLWDAEYNLRVVLLLWAGYRALIGCCGAKSPSAPPERSDGAPVRRGSVRESTRGAQQNGGVRREAAQRFVRGFVVLVSLSA